MKTIDILANVVFLAFMLQSQCVKASFAPAPTNVRGHNTGATSLLVMWSPVPLGSVKGYRVFHTKVNATTPEQVVVVGSTDRQVTIVNLKAFRMYRIQVAAFTSSRNGNKSTAIFVRTDEAPPTKIPKVTSYKALSSTIVSLQWEPLSAEDANGILLGYRVYFLRKQDANDWQTKYKKISVGRNVTSAILTGLQPYTEYGVGAMGFNSKGVDFSLGSYLHINWLTTHEDVPWKAPENLKTSFIFPDKLLVEWSAIPADFANGIIRGFRINLSTEGALEQNVTVSNDTFYAEFESLNECLNYSVNISGFTSKGFGPGTLVDVISCCSQPVILTKYQTRLGQETKPVVLPCNYTSCSNVSIYWKIKGANTIYPWQGHRDYLVGLDGQVVATKITKIAVNGSLQISYVEKNDEGVYQCVVENRFGSSANNISLEVAAGLVRVRFVLTLQNETFDEDMQDPNSLKFRRLTTSIKNEVNKLLGASRNFAVFDVKVWKFSNGSDKADVEILATFDDPQKANEKEVSQEIIATLVGQAASGSIGSLAVKFIVIKGDPPPPTSLQTTDLGPTYAEIKWNPSKFTEAYEIESYSVQLKKVADSVKKYVTVVSFDSHTLETRLTGLEPDSSYLVMVVSNRPGYNSGESMPLEIKTPEDDDYLPVVLAIVIPLIIALFIATVSVCLLYRRRKSRNTLHEEHGLQMLVTSGDPGSSNIYSIPSNYWEIPRDAIQVGKEIGSGAFGVVVKGELCKDNESIPCAIKMLKRFATEEERRDMIKELDVMTSVGTHPNMISLHGACTRDGPLWIVVSLAENGCLLDYLQKLKELEFNTGEYENLQCKGQESFNRGGTSKDDQKLSTEEKLSLGHGIAKGMEHLEKKRFVHRDLAARNILLGRNNVPMVSDFGLSRDIYESGAYEDSRGGKRPVRWMAPESLETYTYNNKTDVWSFGVTLWEIETLGCMPYASMENSQQILDEIKKGYRMEKPIECNEDVYQMMLDCWSANPAGRPTFEDLVLKFERLLTECTDEGYSHIAAPNDNVTLMGQGGLSDKPAKKTETEGSGVKSWDSSVCSGKENPHHSSSEFNGVANQAVSVESIKL